LQFVITGISRGGLYALMALGLTLIYGVMDVSNFAYGEFYMIGAYMGYFAVTDLGLHPLLGIVAAGIVSFLAGALAERGLFYPMRRGFVRGEWLMNTFVLTLGIRIVLQNAAQIILGPKYRGIQSPLGNVRILGVSIGGERIFCFVLALVAIGAVWLLLHRTEIGRAMRAVAQSERGAMLVGINRDNIYTLAFGISTMMAGIAGASLLSINPAYPGAGIQPNTSSWFVMILAGMGSVGGAVISGLGLGLMETFFYRSLGSGWQNVATLCILILTLVVRPAGLFGSKVKG